MTDRSVRRYGNFVGRTVCSTCFEFFRSLTTLLELVCKDNSGGALLSLKDKIVFITGASAGIGHACAKSFAREGTKLLLAARRIERLQVMEPELKELGATGVHSFQLDVRNWEDVSSSIDNLPESFKAVDILVNNAGLSRGLDKVYNGDLQDWEEMIDTNIKGVLYVTRKVAPGMVERGSGHIINIGSIAGSETYPGGNVYCTTKFGVRGLTMGMRIDMLGTGVRVSSVDPGLVNTEFGTVRFHGDKTRADSVYNGMTPLSGDDVAETVLFVATRPPHVTINFLNVMPTDQAGVAFVHRK